MSGVATDRSTWRCRNALSESWLQSVARMAVVWHGVRSVTKNLRLSSGNRLIVFTPQYAVMVFLSVLDRVADLKCHVVSPGDAIPIS